MVVKRFLDCMVKKHTPDFVKRSIKRFLDCLTWDQWQNKSWSQEGEDMVLRRIFEYKADGLYVDVGAHHPKRFSNTYYFYRKGWSGINIDAMPGSMRLFRKWRPRDINLECGVGETNASLDYYIFDETALNGFCSKLSKERVKADNAYEINNIVKVEVRPLRMILDKYLPDQTIDFLSVDVEGFDIDVLRSNDWSKYRPSFVLAEVLKSSLHELDKHALCRFMRECGYVVYAKQVNTVIFKEAKSQSCEDGEGVGSERA